MKIYMPPIRLAILALSTFFSQIASAQTVTFQVDMSVQDSIDRFDPDNDVVEIRGTFNGWAGTTMSLVVGSDSIYEAQIDIFDPVGTEIEYKFFFFSNENGEVWESNAGDGNSGNRKFIYEEGGQALDTFFFDNLDTDPGAGIEVTFQVDMALLIDDGLFVPGFDILEARGGFNSWGGGFELESIEAGSTIYEGTIEVTTVSPGNPVEYKYVYNGGSWEDGENRTFTLASESPQTLRVRFFSDIGPDSALSEDTGIFFTVDMNGAQTMDGTLFDPENDTVFINGAFAGNTWWEWGTAPSNFELLDDGSVDSGDATAGDGIYSITFDALAGDVKKADYKFSINGEDNEAGFQDNHVRYIRETGTYSFPLDTFGEMIRETEAVEPGLGQLEISGPVDGMIIVTWENTEATLERSGNLTSESWIEVPKSEVAGEAKFPVSGAGSRYFRLRR